MMTNRPLFRVDFNEMVDRDVVLLSRDDVKIAIDGTPHALFEGMEVKVCCPDDDQDGNPDPLIASGVVERNKIPGWGADVRWSCRIDNDGIRHQSELDLEKA